LDGGWEEWLASEVSEGGPGAKRFKWGWNEVNGDVVWEVGRPSRIKATSNAVARPTVRPRRPISRSWAAVEAAASRAPSKVVGCTWPNLRSMREEPVN